MKTLSVQDRWMPVYGVWVRFTKTNSQLGLSPSMGAMRRFLGQHADVLVSAGVLTKAAGRHWLADVETFDNIAFRVAIGKLDVAA